MTKLSQVEGGVLCALAGGFTLKSHRYLDGTKIFQLHPLNGPAEPVEKRIVEALQQRHLIVSNQKFPAATYSLTESGREIAVLLQKAVSHLV